MGDQAASLIGLLLLVVLAVRSSAPAPDAGGAAPGQMTNSQIGTLAARAIRLTGAGHPVDRRMIVAMAEIESSRRPTARRWEARLGEASAGLMQVLPSTALWLWNMGYRDVEERPTEATLLRPWDSVYFGTAYARYLSRYKGQPRSAEWIVESYNGGPGNSNANTRRHLGRYQRARQKLVSEGFR